MSTEQTPSVSLEEAAERLHLSVDDVRGLLAAGGLVAPPDQPDRVTQLSLLVYMAQRLSATAERALGKSRPPGGVLEGMAINLILVLGIMAVAVEAYSVGDGNPIFPLPAVVLGTVVAAAAVWGLARRQDGFHSVNGVGLTLYGDRKTPHGRIATSFVVFAGVPLLPVRSYVLLERSEEKSNWSGMIRGRTFYLAQHPGIEWVQAAGFLAAGWAAVAAAMALMVYIG